MTEAEIRALFPATRDLIYFNAAAQGLLPLPVVERMHQVALALAHKGIFTYRADMARIEETRAAAARLLGCGAEDVALTSGTAEGIAKVAGGLDWQPGDEVLLADCEFPANVYPWASLGPRGVKLRFVRASEGRVEAQRLLERVGPRTRVLAVSHVQYSSGYRIDLEPLAAECNERGILLLVDAIQSLGVVPFDAIALGLGAVALEGRKWLMGPAGCGLLYVAPEWCERIRPQSAGVASVQKPEDWTQFRDRLSENGQLDLTSMYRPDARRFEASYPNVVGSAGLGAALELGETIGRDRIRQHIEALVARFVEHIEATPGFHVRGTKSAEERAGIVSFSVPGDPEKLFRKLNGEGISLSVRGGRVRVAPHVYNTADEVDRAMGRIVELCG